MNTAVDTSSAENIVKNTTEFFTTNDLKSIFDQFLSWCAGLVGNVVLAIIIWFVGKKIVKYLVKLLAKALDKSTMDKGVVKFVLSIARFLGNVILVLMVVDVLGFETTSFIAILGSAGLAVGMSLQGSLSNFAGGILILVFKPFTIGDYIVSGGNEGTVTTIDMLYTRLLTPDNKVVVIPNGTLSNGNIVNVGKQPTRRLDIQIGISYGADLKLAKKTLKEILEKNAHVLQDRDIQVLVASLDESCVTLETRSWVNSSDYWPARFELLELYKLTFDEKGIEIPFNQMDVHIVQ